MLSSDDPVRVFQDFATLDLLSGGRAEIMAGRGSFIESFPLFGFDLDDYDELFAEKLALLLALRDQERVTWTRPPPRRRSTTSASTRGRSRTRCRSGSRSAATRHRRSAPGALGLPLALAIIGGMPERFAGFAELHRRAAHRGRPRAAAAAASTRTASSRRPSQQAVDISFPPFKAMMDKIGRERGWPPMTRQHFAAARTLRGANFVGSPQDVIDKILFQHEIFGHQRFLIQFSVGTLPHDQVMRCIELFGTEVAPAVRERLGAGA